MADEPQSTDKECVLEAVAARFFLLEARGVPALDGISPQEIKELWDLASERTRKRCRASAVVAWDAVLHVMKKRRELKAVRERGRTECGLKLGKQRSPDALDAPP